MRLLLTGVAMKQLSLVRSSVVGAVIFFAVVAVHAQTMPTSSASRPASTSMPTSASMPASKPANLLEGVVVDKDNKPIAGATVRAFGVVETAEQGTNVTTLVPLGKATSGDDGTYSIVRAEAGNPKNRTFVVAEKDEYAVGCSDVRSDVAGSVKIIMAAPVITGGQVVDNHGKPIAGARVQLMIQSNPYGMFLISVPECEVIATFTDVDGKFEFKNTPERSACAFIVSAPGKATINTGDRNGHTQSGNKKIKISLPDEAAIQGVLKNASNDKPLVGVTIQALSQNYR
ncbi:MAG: hypothetical protein EHM48_02895, partial [Planctomycetaceae bacterium]